MKNDLLCIVSTLIKEVDPKTLPKDLRKSEDSEWFEFRYKGYLRGIKINKLVLKFEKFEKNIKVYPGDEMVIWGKETGILGSTLLADVVGFRIIL